MVINRLRVYLIFTSFGLLAAILLQAQVSDSVILKLLFGVWLLLSVGILFLAALEMKLEIRAYLWFRARTSHITNWFPFVCAVELLIIALITLAAMAHLIDFSPDWRMPGNELSYLLNSGGVASAVFARTGAIPLWNPFIGLGEPLIESPFSFVLNPFMFLPILLGGVINGTKVAVILHALMMGLGGWTLAYSLRMRSAGRLLLGLTLAGSGSMVGAIAHGFYQISLSQVYVPFVYAGLFGVLRHETKRWYIGLLIVASALLIFAGTFFYVLPTAISCVLIVLFFLIRRNKGTGRLFIDGQVVGRLALAGVLLLLVTAVRMLPQYVNAAYVNHPWEGFAGDYISISTLASLYYLPWLGGDYAVEMNFHFVVWFPLLTTVVIGRIILMLKGVPLRLRLLVPIFLLITLFTFWGQAYSDAPIRKLYDLIQFLGNWRYTARMLAAASIWVAVLVALGFDLLVRWLQRQSSAPALSNPSHWVARVTLLSVLAVGGVSAANVLRSWYDYVWREQIYTLNFDAVTLLRQDHPYEFLSIRTPGFHDYWSIYTDFVRMQFGNPDYHALPLKPTISVFDLSWLALPRYGLDIASPQYFLGYGYKRLWSIDTQLKEQILWWQPDALPQVFMVDPLTLNAAGSGLKRSDVIPVTTYSHEIDSVHVQLAPDYLPYGILVSSDLAYPGWQVTINGQQANLESVGGFLGVILPDSGGEQSLDIVFSYQPTVLYVGGAITVVGVLLLSAYLLGGDRPLIDRARRRYAGLFAVFSREESAVEVEDTLYLVRLPEIVPFDDAEPVRDVPSPEPETPLEMPIGAPADLPAEGVAEAPTEAPAETPAQTPAPVPTPLMDGKPPEAESGHIGRLYSSAANPVASKVGALIGGEIHIYLKEHDIGHLTAEGAAYRVMGEAYTPTVGFIGYGKGDLAVEGVNPQPPDLAVVVDHPSTYQTQKDLLTRVGNYLAAGTTVWMFVPGDSEVKVFAPGKAVRTLGIDDTLDGGAVLPGFSLPLRAVLSAVRPTAVQGNAAPGESS